MKAATRQTPTTLDQVAQPAPVSRLYNRSYIAEIKVIGKGVGAQCKLDTKGDRAADRRAAAIPADYRRMATKIDAALGVEDGEGPCQRRLSKLPLMTLCWGAYGEGSSGVHDLVALLASCLVRTLTVRGEPPSPKQMGLEASNIRGRLSTAAVRAANTVLVARMSHVGEGSGRGGRRGLWSAAGRLTG